MPAVSRKAGDHRGQTGWRSSRREGSRLWKACLSLSRTVEGEFRGVGKKGQACVQLARILQYLECPQ